MAMHNTSAGSNQDEVDLTMIDPSLLYDDNYQPTSNSVVKHLQRANQSTTSKARNPDNKHDYVYVEHNRLEVAEEIERILNYYRQELKQDSNTLPDCNQQLIIRLVDFIRPIYSSQRKKLEDLDALIEDISVLQALPFIEQREKNEQLNNEILHLKKLIIKSAHEGDQSDNTMTKVYRINSMVNYRQWMEMEEETRKLHNLVQTQRDKINELIKLLSQEDEAPDGNQRSSTDNINPKSTPVTLNVQDSPDQQQDSGTNKFQKSTDEFHAPGVSSIHSMIDFLAKSLLDTGNNETQNEEKPIAAVRALLPALSRLSSYNDLKKCPICQYEFLKATTDSEIADHVEKCIIDNNNPTEANQYSCPNCNEQISGNDKDYLQHLTDCFNERTNTF